MSDQDFLPATDRTPPHLLEAEEAVIGGILLDPDAITRVVGIVESESFYLGAHKAIFAAAIALHSKGKVSDLTNVVMALADANQLEKVGGHTRLTELVDKTLSTASIAGAAKLVAEKHLRRKLLAITEEINTLVYDKGCKISRLLDTAETRIFSLTANSGDEGPKWSGDILARVFDQITISSGEEKGPGIPTGFHDLDSLTQGLQRTDLIILAARPAMGKTAVALNLARNVAKTGLPVIIFSLEMSEEQLMSRLIAIETGIETSRQRNGELRREEWGLLAHGVSELSKIPIAINDRSSTGVAEMRAQCRQLAAKMGQPPGLIIVDYLQLMEGRGTDNRVQEVSRITRSLKGMAKELDTPVMALSQLSRAVEQRTNKRPMLSDLRESGSIEQDADLVAMLYRDEYYNPETPDRGITEVIIAKSRHGSVGTVRLLFESQFTRFRSAEGLPGNGHGGGGEGWVDD